MLRAPAVVALAVIAITAGPARAADEPTDEPVAAQAKQHYNDGQKLYEEGHYEEAIVEFEQAYRLKPHPNTLYNVGQAYERLLDYAQSVIWFERFLAEAPADAPLRPIVENRLRILRTLPARISVTTIPEHVHAAVVDEQGKRRDADTPTVFKVPAGHYQLQLDQSGWESEEHEVDADIGQPYFYQYRLKRSTAQVTIFTKPRGARVFIDDRLVGETPFAGTVEVGRHRLLLEHRDYPWHREDLIAASGAPIRREVTLTRPLRSGRTELVLASMVFGGAAGPLLVAAVNGNNDFGTSSLGLVVYMLSSAAGIGAGFLGSFLATREGGVKVGHSSLMIGSTIWGAALATSLGLGLDIRSQYVYALAIAGLGVGMSTGILLSRKLDISAGDAALVNSGGTWGTAAGALLTQAIFVHPSGSQFGWFLLGGTTVGVLGGALLGMKLELSRGHVALIDVGGLAGTGLGFALGYVIAVNSGEDRIQVGARYSLGGLTLGLLAAAVLSRKYKGDLPPVEALLRHHDGRWAFGLPSISVDYAVTKEGTAPRMSLTLARGTF